MRTCECSRPLKKPGHQMCDTCFGELTTALSRVPGLQRELATTAARLDAVKVGTSIESKTVSTTVSDPVNFSAITCGDQLRALMNTLPRRIDMKDAQNHPEAPSFKRRLDRMLSRAMVIIDREPERQHLGPCPTEDCGEPMNPVRGEYEHHCLVCGETTVIASHQGAKLGAAWSVVARPPQLVPVLASLGVKISTSKLSDWSRKCGLDAAGEIDGYPAYRVSDVYDVAMRMQARKKTSVTKS